jgi:hypothetical protein
MNFEKVEGGRRESVRDGKRREEQREPGEGGSRAPCLSRAHLPSPFGRDTATEAPRPLPTGAASEDKCAHRADRVAIAGIAVGAARDIQHTNTIAVSSADTPVGRGGSRQTHRQRGSA